eukprot:351055-Chlamydomonas_euryale.AAC.1
MRSTRSYPTARITSSRKRDGKGRTGRTGGWGRMLDVAERGSPAHAAGTESAGTKHVHRCWQ